MSQPASSADRLRRLDSFRGPGRWCGGPPGHKEWWHFSVQADGVDLLLNGGLADVRRADGRWQTEGRLVVLIRRQAWDGHAARIPEAELTLRHDRAGLRLGGSALWLEDGAYHLHVEVPERRFSARLRVVPTSEGIVAPVTPLEGRSPIHWALVPRLMATGEVIVGGEQILLRDAPCYHDHNWGTWRWEDLAWEWGYALPAASPWLVIMALMTDRTRSRRLSAFVSLWQDGSERRSFRDGEVTVEREGLLSERVLRLPRPLALGAPRGVARVPRRLTILCAARGERLTCTFEAEDFAELLVPDDEGLSLTTIDEIVGTWTVEGAVGGEDVAMVGRGVLERMGP